MLERINDAANERQRARAYLDEPEPTTLTDELERLYSRLRAERQDLYVDARKQGFELEGTVVQRWRGRRLVS